MKKPERLSSGFFDLTQVSNLLTGLRTLLRPRSFDLFHV